MQTRRTSWAVAAVAAMLGGCGRAPSAELAAGERAETPAIDTAQGGRASWVRRLGGAGHEAALALAAGADGSTTLLTGIGATGPYATAHDAIGLVRLDPAGGVSWSRQLPLRVSGTSHASIAVTGQGNTFLALVVACAGTACPDLGLGALSRGALLKFDRLGRLLWQRLLAADELLTDVAVDASGGAALAVARAGAAPRIVRYAWDGAQVWDLAAPRAVEPAPRPGALPFDPAGNLAVGDGLAFYSLDPAGRVRWTRRLSDSPGGGRIASIGATALGTVVAVAQVEDGQISWAGTSATAAAPYGAVFLAVAEATGAPRLGRVLATGEWAAIGAAVDPAGRVAILTREALCVDRVERWNLAGDRLWERFLGSCGTGFFLGHALAVEPRAHHVRVGGRFAGAVDLGGLPLTSRGGTDAFVLDLLP